MKTTTVRIPAEKRDILKIIAGIQRKEMKQILSELIDGYIKRNKKTLEMVYHSNWTDEITHCRNERPDKSDDTEKLMKDPNSVRERRTRYIRLPENETPGIPDVVNDLAAYGAPLWSNGCAPSMTLECAIARGLEEARVHPSLLRVLPIVLWENRSELCFEKLCASVRSECLPRLGMLLDLAAALTSSDVFSGWAEELFKRVSKKDPPVLFFANGSTGRMYRELAEVRTPDVVRKWGFLMTTPIQDFQDAMEKFCVCTECAAPE